MREYIQNLTDNLIAKNHYDVVDLKLRGEKNYPASLVDHVKLDLAAGDVRKMNPETLGKIMCSLETGDVMANKQELLVDNLGFGGDCEDLLRELVSLCLAFAIRDRLDNYSGFSLVPPYRCREKKAMVKVSIKRLDEIERYVVHAPTLPTWGEESSSLLNLARLTGKFDAYAKKFNECFGVSRGELETYVVLQEYCHRLADCGNFTDKKFPLPEVVAEEVGIPVQEFTKWVNREVNAYRALETHQEAEMRGGYDD